MKASRIRKLTLLLAALAAAGGYLFKVHDGILIAMTVAAAGLLLSSRDRKALALAGLLIVAGLLGSSLDREGCSVWFRGKVVLSKLRGGLPDASWAEVKHYVLSISHCYSPVFPARIDTKVFGDTQVELLDTSYGRFWIAVHQGDLLRYLITETFVGQDYTFKDVAVRPGDTVVDCGSHVGVFTRYALERGAAKVIAIEPDPTTLRCFEANLEQEIRSGRVVLVRAGVWDQPAELKFARHPGNSGANSFVRAAGGAEMMEGIPVRPLDDIVEELALDRVDFIKMDIEGAEQRALLGAKHTLKRFRPRMAICTYHSGEDPEAIEAIIQRIDPAYRAVHRDFTTIYGTDRIGPKITYFSVPENLSSYPPSVATSATRH